MRVMQTVLPSSLTPAHLESDVVATSLGCWLPCAVINGRSTGFVITKTQRNKYLVAKNAPVMVIGYGNNLPEACRIFNEYVDKSNGTLCPGAQNV